MVFLYLIGIGCWIIFIAVLAVIFIGMLGWDISEFYVHVEWIDEFREAVRSAVNQGQFDQGQFDQGQLVRVCVDAISPYLH